MTMKQICHYLINFVSRVVAMVIVMMTVFTPHDWVWLYLTDKGVVTVGVLHVVVVNW